MKNPPYNQAFGYLTAFLCVYLLVTGCTSKSHSKEMDLKNYKMNEHIINGHLAPCPKSPNCVSSESSKESVHISPLAFTGSASKAWKRLEVLLLDMGGKIESMDRPFLHVTFRSRLFGFVDDLTCRLDEEKNLIQIRSAARTGYWDSGVNRKRVEELQRRFASSAREE